MLTEWSILIESLKGGLKVLSFMAIAAVVISGTIIWWDKRHQQAHEMNNYPEEKYP